jgi:branched-chain amino acid aminotransferase
MSKTLGIPVFERHIKAEEMSKADAAFLTGTAIELMPVSVIDSKEYQINHPLIKRVEGEFNKLTMNG